MQTQTNREQILANLSGRRTVADCEGREYIVTPMTLIVSGVLNGSEGPLYYPPEELERNVEAWNGMPLVVYHPNINGEHTSARTPAIFTQRTVGQVFNARMQGNRLTAEGWFDVERTRAVDPRVLDKLRNNEPIEVSTGLFTENERAAFGANHKGKRYTHIARNYKPDHLAILPDQRGACSLKDGCGVLANKETAMIDRNDTLPLPTMNLAEDESVPRRRVECPNCTGSGIVNGMGCPTCYGTGYIEESTPTTADAAPASSEPTFITKTRNGLDNFAAVNQRNILPLPCL